MSVLRFESAGRNMYRVFGSYLYGVIQYSAGAVYCFYPGPLFICLTADEAHQLAKFMRKLDKPQ